MATYDASGIEVLSELEAVRKRPGMYIGNVHDGSALHHMLWEVLGNCLDEHLAGRCRTVGITLHEGGAASVEDDGGGIAVERTVGGLPFLEAIFTRLHFGGTLDDHSPHMHAGLHGVGVAAVNALSSTFVVEVWRGGKHYRQEYRRGRPEGPLSVVGDADRQGTRVTFTPDAGIFRRPEFDAGLISNRLREFSLLCPHLTATFADERKLRFHHPGGLADYVAFVNRDGRPLHAPIACRGEAGRLTVEAALQWAEAGRPEPRFFGFVNLLRTADGGTHIRGLSHALVGMYLERTGAERPRGARRRRRIAAAMSSGLAAVVSVGHYDPAFGEPTRSRLANPEVTGLVVETLAPALRRFCQEQPEAATAIVEAARKALAPAG